jgi:hypothetical protein
MCKTGGKCMIGGAPVLLVEDASARGRRALALNTRR